MNVLEQAVAGLIGAWELFVRGCPGGRFEQVDGVARVETRLPVPSFNGVWTATEDADPRRVLAEVDDLATGSLPWNVQVRPGCSPDIVAGLQERGLQQVGDIPFMTVTADALTPAAGLPLRKVVTFDDLARHLELVESAFGMPEELTRRGFPMAMLFQPGITPWLGEVDGQAVTTSLGVEVAGTVGVFNVSTPEQHRGRGYGGAATRQAIGTGLAAGAACGWLQASAMGEPVYVGLGFRTDERWSQWVLPQFGT